ncbi:MOSC and FAD-binding oxidoreductase domain-containing protein [Nocardioides sp. URHA0032]|uniref:MOSC and FAD-binding oxidoreductase domain-containing protein n=1 Tax=Nocardioides sp. URHA0032 TaxID=1380388 RepID=UPI0004913485|nr:MOSC and FAD-binding oxidoreductase domain-containing protein [Nocardioides sp. URHA0032]
MARLLSVNVGMPKDVSWRGRTVHTGVWKSPVSGPRLVRRLNIDGDGQGDLAGHGGEQRAVLVYQVESYRYWADVLQREDLEPGAFGENFTVEGLADEEVCIGDRYRIGEAELEVSQPRVTCFRVGMRLGEPRLPSLLVAHHRPGFYLRVLTEGHVRAGDPIERTRRGPHELSVAAADALLYLPGHDPERLADALDIPALSPGWQGSFRSMLESGGTGQPAGVAVAPPPAWPGFRTLTVTDVVAETSSVTSYRLASDDPLPPYRPGQFLTLRVPGSGDPVPVRTYSLSGGPDGEYRISVKRETQGRVSSYLQAHLRPGDSVEVAAPRGDFVLDDDGAPVLLVSAGIGLTPVLAMLHRLASEDSTREVWWVHTTHDADSHAFAGEVTGLLGRLPASHSVVYYTTPAQPPAAGSGVRTGRLTAEAVAALGVPATASAYVCGPDSFMADVGAALAAAGLDPTRIHTERFGSRSPINPGVVGAPTPVPHQPPGPPGTGPAVTFGRSGITAAWADGYGSVLELAEACDVPTQWSCRTGVCHTCVTAVLSGSVAYATPPLEAPGADEVLICSATPAADLVVDL